MLAASLLTVVLTASACSSGETPAGSADDPSRQALNARMACEKYYAFDLYRHTTAADVQDADEVTRVRILKDYRDLATAMAASVQSATTVGDLPTRAQVNADRIVRILGRISAAGGDIWDVSGAVDAKLDRSSRRIETLCVAANSPVPAENIDARQASAGS